MRKYAGLFSVLCVLITLRDDFRKAGGMVLYDALRRYSSAERTGQDN
jgi:hypothetical protein